MLEIGDRVRTHHKVCRLLKDKCPDQQISQSTVRRIESRFREHDIVKNLSKAERLVKTIIKDLKFDVLLETEGIHIHIDRYRLIEELL